MLGSTQGLAKPEMKPDLEVFFTKITVMSPEALPLCLGPPLTYFVSCLVFTSSAFSPHLHAPASISSCGHKRLHHLRSQAGEKRAQKGMALSTGSPELPLPCAGAGCGWRGREKQWCSEAFTLITCLLLLLEPRRSPRERCLLAVPQIHSFLGQRVCVCSTPTMCQELC